MTAIEVTDFAGHGFWRVRITVTGTGYGRRYGYQLWSSKGSIFDAVLRGRSVFIVVGEKKGWVTTGCIWGGAQDHTDQP
jgi:hypothetical protein